jgi:CHAD domain-containing protein
MALSPGGKWIDAIRPDGSVCDAARLSLEARLMTVVHYVPLAADHAEENLEHVHRLRVSTRRAMAALQLYRDWLPRKRTKWVKKQLKRARRAAGEARDLDVLAGRLQREYGERATNVAAFIADKRSAVQPDISRLAERFRRKEKFVRKSAKLIATIKCTGQTCTSRGTLCFRNWAAEQLASHADEFLSAMPGIHGDLAELHQFRIAAKALRYSIELLAPALGPEVRETHYRTVEELQERLGKINDHATARDRMREWAIEPDGTPIKDTLCEFAEEEVARLTAELDVWRMWWTHERVEQLREGLV